MANTPRAPWVVIDVSDERIKEAVPRDSSHCMIAEAVKASYPGAAKVSVDLQTIRFSDPKRGLRFTYLTPRVAQVALIKFDQGILPEPMSFRLRGGMVTRAGSRLPKTPASPEMIEQRKKASKKGQEQLAKTRLVHRDSAHSDSVPDRIGGRTPPTTPFAKRRAFGLRGLER